ncbi:P-loop containing nucleoside triphosphate hydrolase protein [Suillus paluster]|uniref:P-loop containing nucleoside triphosphate hydrolase protein n=1 Tax=Suillus paluster TaxID=48578 RepID=UPI001B869715|nr:P-loop containing nucleoside triphosphate hydrolase protein [Suillus paluster]KAG1747163.1 P-loop containing nucleoside triphosphate hydrolase protein [Suillus paluster]
MGATGSGKSTFINKASGSDLPVGDGLESCTSEVRTSRPFVVGGSVVTLIDTPGFDDTSRTDTDILSMIAAYLSKTYEHGARLAGVIYMHRISDFKMGGTSKRNFKIFRELCGESSLKNVLIVTNMWSEVKREIGEARESELASKDKFFKPVLEKGARLLRHEGSLESAHTILRYLINSQPATLRIQQELVDERKSIEKTAAGSELRRALDEQAENHKEEIRNLRVEMEAAMRAKDDETRGELQEELEKKKQECLRIEQTAQRMAAEFAAERARLEARILQMEGEHQQQLQTLENLQDEVAAKLREEETRRQQLQDELLYARQEIEEAARSEERRKQEEAAAAKTAEEEANSRLAEQQKLAKQREEEQWKATEQEVARARKELEEAQAHEGEQRKAAEQEVARAREELKEAHARAEREAAAAKEVHELERARLLEELKKREEENRRRMEEELAQLKQLVAQSEEQSANLRKN